MSADTQQQIVWEARQRPRAAIAAFLSAVLALAVAIATPIAFSDAPRTSILESLDRASAPGATFARESLRVPFYEFYDDRALFLIGSSVASAIGLIAMGWALGFLGVATRSRRPEFPKRAVPLPLVGGALSGLGAIGLNVASVIAVNDFLGGSRSVEAASEIGGTGGLVASQLVQIVGNVALGFAFITICLNAMRTGLLTRFLGVLGISVGALSLLTVIIPLGAQLQFVQIFWLIALGVVLLGRGPRGLLPAWRTGEAEPWPSQEELRAARQSQQKGAQAVNGAEDEDVAEPVTSGASTSMSSKKRKRRKR